MCVWSDTSRKDTLFKEQQSPLCVLQQIVSFTDPEIFCYG